MIHVSVYYFNRKHELQPAPCPDCPPTTRRKLASETATLPFPNQQSRPDQLLLICPTQPVHAYSKNHHPTRHVHQTIQTATATAVIRRISSQPHKKLPIGSANLGGFHCHLWDWVRTARRSIAEGYWRGRVNGAIVTDQKDTGSST